jgi:hypothetical protein
MFEQQDQMSMHLNQVYSLLNQVLTILSTLQHESQQDMAQLDRASRRVKQASKIAELLAKAQEIKEKFDAALDAMMAAIFSACAVIVVTESEEGMAALEAKLDNLAGLMSEVSAEMWSIHSRARDFSCARNP